MWYRKIVMKCCPSGKYHNESEKWDPNMCVRSGTHEVSNQSMQALQGPQPSVIGKWGDERTDYNARVRLDGLAMGNSICKGDKVNRLLKWWSPIIWPQPRTSCFRDLTCSILKLASVQQSHFNFSKIVWKLSLMLCDNHQCPLIITSLHHHKSLTIVS